MKNEFPELLGKQEDNNFTIKVPLKSILYKNGVANAVNSKRSDRFFRDINNRIVPKWNFIKSNFYVKYILSSEPTKEIPLFNKVFFDYLIRICTVCQGERATKDKFDPSIKVAHKNYMQTFKETPNCVGYHRSLTTFRGINDRTGYSSMLENLRNQLQIECTENFKRNYTKKMIKYIKFLHGDDSTKEQLDAMIDDFLNSADHLDIIRKFNKNVEFQRKMLENLHKIQIEFEEHIEEHKLNKTK